MSAENESMSMGDPWQQARQDLFRWICRNEDRRRVARGLPCVPLLKSVATWPDEPFTILDPYIPFVSPLSSAPEVPADTMAAIGATHATPAASERVLVAV